jgi:replicative DNA helicase
MSHELFSLSAEQAVLGSILRDNDAVDRITSLEACHFYRADHRMIYEEMTTQIFAGKQVDAVTLAESLGSRVVDALQYLIELHSSAVSAANIVGHAAIVSDRSLLRSLASFGIDVVEQAKTAAEPALTVFGRLAQELDAIGQCKDDSAPVRADELLTDYMDIITARMDGTIKPISTGFTDLDRQLDGGLERGTLTVVAARPAMGKTAMGLALARNVAVTGPALFISMEMSKTQIGDRNIAALGGIPISWLRKPNETDKSHWDRMTVAIKKVQELALFIDDKTALSIAQIRAKARGIKRKHGLDLLVVDQLSFIAGTSNENKAYEIGEHTRGLVALAKELDCAVVLLAQLNRDCEKRQNRRPIMADLAMSGSIEQDAANVIFLYRDEVYHPETRDKEICEVITGKQRQGAPGVVGLHYVGSQTMFRNLQHPWKPAVQWEKLRSSGFE